MTVPSEAHYQELNWTGAETQFAPGFRAESTADVTVKYRDSDDELQTLALNTHYTVTLAGDGTVTVLPVALPAASLAVPVTLIFERVTPAINGTEFSQLGRYTPAAHQTLHDRAFRILGELRGRIARALTTVYTDDFVDFRARRVKGAQAVDGDEFTTYDQVLTLTGLASIAASVAAAAASAMSAAASAAASLVRQTASEAARDLAQLWASQIEDTPVTTGPSKYSALHWAAKAAASATLVLAALAVTDYGTVAAAPTETRDYGTVP